MFKLTIQTKLVCLILVFSLLPFGIVAAMAYLNGRAVLMENIGHSLREKAFQTIDKIDRLLYFNRQNVKSWADEAPMQDVLTDDADGRITKDLTKLKETHGVYSGIFLANEQGRIAASSEVNTIGRDVSHESWFQETLKSSQLTMGGLEYDRLVGGFTLNISIPIAASYDPSRNIGVLSAHLNWSELFEITNSAEINRGKQDESGYVVLINKNGLLISGPDFLMFQEEEEEEEEVLSRVNFIDSGFQAAQRAARGERGYLVEKDPSGNEVLVGYAASEGHRNFRGLNWSVLLIQQTKDAFAPVKEFQRQIIWIGMFTGILVLALALLLSRRLSIPLRQLNDAALNLAKGNFSSRIYVRSNDEIGTLADTFNKMSEDLQQSMEKIQIQNKNLVEKESKLYQTLLELKQRNEELAEQEKAIRKMYNELKGTQNQLVQSEKLASIGQLAAGVAHEINNPVGFINSNMEILQQYISDYAKILNMTDRLQESVAGENLTEAKSIVAQINKLKEDINLDYVLGDTPKLLEHSRKGIERIQKIVMDLRTFARDDKNEMEPAKIEEVIEGILNIVHNEIKYKAKLEKDYGDTPLIQCSPQRLGQVFINLIVNALHAIEGTGTIAIKTYKQDGFVCVDVRDTGKGIPPENLNKIYDPFFTTKPVGQGTGLGLSVSHEIIQKHNGSLNVRSKVGEGTTFTVMLPINQKKGEGS